MQIRHGIIKNARDQTGIKNNSIGVKHNAMSNELSRKYRNNFFRQKARAEKKPPLNQYEQTIWEILLKYPQHKFYHKTDLRQIPVDFISHELKIVFKINYDNHISSIDKINNTLIEQYGFKLIPYHITLIKASPGTLKLAIKNNIIEAQIHRQ